MIRGLNSIRAIAILLVLISHLPIYDGLMNKIIFEHGQLGVILFFGLSGFLLEYTTSNRPFSMKNFTQKRLVRLLPAYYLALLVTFIIAVLDAGKLIQLDMRVLIGNMLFLQDLPRLGADTVEPFMKNAPLWSLSYEFWFYVIFALINKFFARSYLVERLILWVSVSFLLVSSIYPSFVTIRLGYFSFFWFGVLASKLFISNKLNYIDQIALVYPFLLATFVLVIWNYNHMWNIEFYRKGDGGIIRHLIYFFSAIVIVPLTYNIHSLILDRIASISYGIYVFHAPLCYKYQLFNSQLWCNWLFGILMTIILAIIVDIYLNNKIREWIR